MCAVRRNEENFFVCLFRLFVLPRFDRVEMLFFLDMSDVKSLIMAKRDKLLYPSYDCRRHGSPFQSREQMMAYIGATHLLHLFLSLTDQLPDQNAWGSSSSDDVPVPGRPIRPVNLPPDFCDTLVLKACLGLHEDGCFDLKNDPLLGERRFKSLNKMLETVRVKDGGNLEDLVAALSRDDCAPLAMFEPDVLKNAEEKPWGSAAAASQSQLSQSHLSYMLRFKREYVLLYVLRFGVDCKC